MTTYSPEVVHAIVAQIDEFVAALDAYLIHTNILSGVTVADLFPGPDYDEIIAELNTIKQTVILYANVAGQSSQVAQIHSQLAIDASAIAQTAFQMAQLSADAANAAVQLAQQYADDAVTAATGANSFMIQSSWYASNAAGSAAEAVFASGAAAAASDSANNSAQAAAVHVMTANAYANAAGVYAAAAEASYLAANVIYGNTGEYAQAAATSASAAAAFANSSYQAASASQQSALEANTSRASANLSSFNAASAAQNATTAMATAIQYSNLAVSAASLANSYANAAAVSMTAAAVFANNSQQSANIAQLNAISANVSSAAAGLSEISAAGAMQNAIGAAANAATSRILAAEAANTAGTYAGAAAGSATTAAGFANSSAAYANAANISELAARTSANNANTAAAAAVVSAQTAASFSNAAGSYANAATQSALYATANAAAANTSSNQAGVYAANAGIYAQQSVDAAANSTSAASRANTSAGIATAAELNANNYAAAAFISSTNAASFANAAGQSASIAQTSALTANAVYQGTVGLITNAPALPYDFKSGFLYWTNSAAGDPTTVANAAGTIITNDTNLGTVGQFTWTSITGVYAKGALTVVPGRVYEVRARFYVNASDGSVPVGISVQGMNASYAATSAINNTGLTTVTTNAIQEISAKFSDVADAVNGVTAWPASSIWLRFGIRSNSTESGLDLRVSEIRITDITQALSASKSAASALIYSQNAASASANALAAAAAANVSSGLAAAAQLGANNYAIAAANSATQAAAFANNSGNFANAAQSSALSANASYGALVSSIQRGPILPFDFRDGLSSWTSNRTGDPSSVLTAAGTIVSDTEFGDCNQITTWTTSGANIMTRGVLPATPGRTYKITARFKATISDGSTGWTAIAAWLKNDYTAATGSQRIGPAVTVTTTDVQEITMYVSDVSGTYNGETVWAWPSDAAYIRFGLRLNTTETGLTTRVGIIKVEDVTESSAAANSSASALIYSQNAASAMSNAIAAASAANTSAGLAVVAQQGASNSASAASNSAVVASSAANAAGASANIASIAAIAAQANNGSAQAAANAAAGSAASANSSAAWAQSNAALSATYATSANLTAALQMPFDFNQDGTFWSTSYVGVPTTLTPITIAGVFNFVTVSGIGRVLQVSTTGSGDRDVASIGWVKVTPGRKYSITARVRKTAGTGTLQAQLYGLTMKTDGTAGTHVSVTSTLTTVNQWYDVPLVIDADTLLATGEYLRPMLRLTNTSGAVYQIVWIKVEDITQSDIATAQANIATNAATAANSSASWAAGNSTLSATWAGYSQGNATSSQTSANNASANAVSANASAVAAAANAVSAAGFANTALTYRNTAQSAAIAANTSATSANNSAANANSSASLSAGFASDAGLYANNALVYRDQSNAAAIVSQNAAASANSSAAAANTSALLSASYSSAAGLTAMQLMPSDFIQDGNFWSNTYLAAPANAVPIQNSASYTFLDVANIGRVLQVTSATTYRYVSSTGQVNILPDRMYRLTTSVRSINNTSPQVVLYNGHMFANQAASGNTSTSMTLSVQNQWYNSELIVDSDAAIALGGVYTRPIIRIPNTNGHIVQIAFLKFEDVTESMSAAGFANVAAAQANIATNAAAAANSSSAWAAGNSTLSATWAGYSQSNALAANTAAGWSSANALAANTQAGYASGNALAANTRAGWAAGNATVASTQAGYAAGNAQAALDYAGYASGNAASTLTYRNTAQSAAIAANTSATSANNSAASANSSASLSAGYASNTQILYNNSLAEKYTAPLLPYTFLDGLVHWTGMRAGAPNTISAASGTIVTDPDMGVSFNSNWVNGGTSVNSRGYVPLIPDRIYEISSTFKAVANDGVVRMHVIAGTMYANMAGVDDYAYSSTNGPLINVAANTVQTVSRLFSTATGTDITTIDPSIVYIRPGLRMSTTEDSCNVTISSIKIADVTDRQAALLAAASSLAYANVASSAATAANSSAASANASQTLAATFAANAAVYANNALTYSTQANASANIAVNAATAANSSSASAASNATLSATWAGHSQSNAVAANTYAGYASANALAANNFRTWAASNATAANTSATSANNSAASANSSASLSAGYASNTQILYNNSLAEKYTAPLLPYTFLDGLIHWSGMRAGAPNTISAASGTIVTDPDMGVSFNSNWVNGGTSINSRGYVPLIPDRIYEISSTFKAVAADGVVRMHVVAGTMYANMAGVDDYAYSSTNGPLINVSTNTVQVISSLFSTAAGSDITTIDPSIAYIRPGLRMSTAESSCNVTVGSIRISDVTERQSALLAAASSLAYANVATAAATAANSSAASANSSANLSASWAGYSQANATLANTLAGYASANALAANNFRTWAAGNATAAAASATAANSSASWAAGNSTLSATWAGYSQSNATVASTQAGYASGNATTANTQAGYAAGNATVASTQAGYAAGNAATTLTYRNTAQSAATAANTSATSASNSAASANISATLSASFSTQTQLVAASLLPSDFVQDGTFWQSGGGGGAPSTLPSIMPDSFFSFVDVANVGRVIEVISNTSYRRVGTEGVQNLIPGRKYRATAQARVISATTAPVNLYVYGMGPDYVSLGTFGNHSQNLSVQNQWYNYSVTVDADALIASGVTYIRPQFRLDNTAGHTVQYAFIKLEDVTESTAAALSSSWSASNATAASASAIAANSSSASANSSANLAASYSGYSEANALVANTQAGYASANALAANNFRTWAASNATAAAASATAANSSSSFAAGNATLSATWAGYSQGNATVASTQAGYASGNAVTANTQAGFAAANAVAANNFRTWAASNATAANTSATSANNSAAAANSSASLSATYSSQAAANTNQAITNIASIFPEFFDATGTYFFGGNNSASQWAGDPAVKTMSPADQATIVLESGFGYVISPAVEYYILPKGVIPTANGKIYEITAEWEVVTYGGVAVSLRVYPNSGLNADFSYFGAGTTVSLSATATGVYTQTMRIADTASTGVYAWGGAAYCRPRFRWFAGTGSTVYLRRVSIKDVTVLAAVENQANTATGAAVAASASASAANSSAAAANSSAVLTASYQSQVFTSTALTLPSDFTQDNTYWSASYNGTPNTLAQLNNASYVFTSVAGVGRILEITTGGSQKDVAAIGWMKIIPGRFYRATVRAMRTAGTSASSLQIWIINNTLAGGAGTHIGSGTMTMALQDTWYDFSVEGSGDTLFATGEYIRPMLRVYNTTGSVYRIFSIRLEDITESSAAAANAAAASSSATAANSSASFASGNATLSATWAGHSQSNAATAATQAGYASANALAANNFRTWAASNATAANTSAAAANSSAAAANSSATLSATYSSAANLTAAQLMPYDFQQYGTFWFNGITGDPATRTPIVADSIFYFYDIAGVGRVIQVISNAAYRRVTNIGVQSVVAGRTYKVSAFVRSTGNTNVSVTLLAYYIDSSWNNTGSNGVAATLPSNGTWTLMEAEVSGDTVLAAGQNGFRLSLRVINEAGHTIEIAYLKIVDITESKSAANSAAIATAQANIAISSATSANSSAAAASANAVLAANYAANAASNATAAAANAVSAAASAVAANSSASFASGNATLSSTYAGWSQSNAAVANTQAGYAAANALTANTRAGWASGNATSALAYRNTAQTAAIQANNAATSANDSAASANASSILSASYAGAANASATAAQTLLDYQFPRTVGPINGASYEASSTGSIPSFTFAYGPTSSWPTPYITASVGGEGGEYNRITFKQSIPKIQDRRYRIWTWFWNAGNNSAYAAIWVLNSDNNVWDANAVGQNGDAVISDGTNYAPINSLGWNKVGCEITVGSGWKGLWKPVFELKSANSTTIPNGIWHITGINVDDITSEAAANTFAAAAAASAAAANSSASWAQSNATLSATYAGWSSSNAVTANTRATWASGNATTANTRAGWASGNATAAAASATAAAANASSADTFRTWAASNATAAAASATAANSSAASASSNATLSATYAGYAAANASSADTFRTWAAANAAAANTSMTSANASAALASTYASVSAQISGGGIIPNSVFADWPVGQTFPTGYSIYGTGNPTKGTGWFSQYAVAMSSVGANNAGMVTASFPDTLKVGHWFVLEADVFNNGANSVAGSGVLLQIYNSSSTTVENIMMGFGAEPDTAGNVATTTAGPRRWRKLVRVTASDAYGYRVYVMQRWSGMTGYVSTGNTSLLWHRVNVRPATDQEIASNTATGQITQLQANVTTLTNATANLTSAIATINTRLQAGSPNLLPNGGFENGLSYWSSAGGGWGVATNGWGPYAYTTSTGTVVLQSNPVPINQLQPYTLACDPLCYGSGGTIYVDMIFYYANGSVALDTGQNSLNGTFDFDTTTNRRSQIAITATAPTNAATVICRVVGNGVSGGTIAVRQMKLEQGSTWSPYSSEASVNMVMAAVVTANAQIATLSTNVGTALASISTLSSVTANLSSNIATLQARYAVTVNAGGYITGFELSSNGQTGIAKFGVDQFEIGKTGTGARTIFANGAWKIYDANNVLRVQLGNLDA